MQPIDLTSEMAMLTAATRNLTETNNSLLELLRKLNSKLDETNANMVKANEQLTELFSRPTKEQGMGTSSIHYL